MRTSSGKGHSSLVHLAKLLCTRQLKRQRVINIDPFHHNISNRKIHQNHQIFKMPAIQTVSLVVLLVAVLPMCLSYPSLTTREAERPQCEGCGNHCEKCTYGVILSPMCGVLECRKGPNEHCGGLNNKNGVCGDGMYCRCEICIGCSTHNLKCSGVGFDPCSLSNSPASSPWDSLRNQLYTFVR